MLKNVMDTALSGGAKAGDAFMLESSETRVTFEHGRLKGSSKRQSRGIGVRVVKDERLGFASSSDLRDSGLVARSALEVANSGEHTEIQFPSEAEYDQPEALVDESLRQLPVEEMIDDGSRFVSRMKEYDDGILVGASIVKEDSRISFANSEGLEASYEKTACVASLSAQIIEGTTVIFCYRAYAGTERCRDFDQLIEKIVEDCGRAKQPASTTSGRYPVIFTPRAMVELSEFLREGIDGRNVQKGISPIREKMGEEILDDRITIFENGLLPGGIDSAPFDDEGVPTRKKPIVEGGVLRSFIMDLSTAAKLHNLPTGNGFRCNAYTGAQDYESVPAPKATNWIMEPGDTRLADLMSGMGKGVLVDDMMGLFSSNFLAGDFSGNLSLGYLVKDGKIAGRLKDAMVSGNLYSLLRDNLIDLSVETERVSSSGTCIFPYVALKDVMVTC